MLNFPGHVTYELGGQDIGRFRNVLNDDRQRNGVRNLAKQFEGFIASREIDQRQRDHQNIGAQLFCFLRIFDGHIMALGRDAHEQRDTACRFATMISVRRLRSQSAILWNSEANPK